MAVFGVMQAWILRDLIDQAVGKDLPGFIRYAVYLVGVIALQLILRAMVRFLKEYAKSSFENCFKRRLFESLLYRDYAEVTAVHSEEWMNRLTSDTVVVAAGLTEIVPEVTGMVVRLFGALFAVLYLVHGFSWLLIPAGLLLAGLTYLFRKKLKELHKRIQEADGKLRVFLSERLSNLLIVRTFAREDSVLEQAEQAMSAHQKARMRRNHFANFCNVGIGVMIRGAFAIAAIYCGYGILTGTMTYGTFTAVLQLIGQIQSPFANLSSYFPQYYAMIASAERLMEAETFAPDGTEPKKSEQQIRSFYETDFFGVGLSHAGFTYRSIQQGESAQPRSVVLSDVNAMIRKGDTVAVTGPSGCGKSTLLKLLMCLYPLDAGERLLYHKNGDSAPLTASWRGLFAYVPQGNQLMSGTIRSVVTFGERNVPDERIHAALKIACADGFLAELPDGLDTVLGERGTGLSEGQMQRLAIARAILSEHPILLLDEATSSLDEATETELLHNLQKMTDRTVLIVTHRMKVLSICTREVQMTGEGIRVEELHHATDNA